MKYRDSPRPLQLSKSVDGPCGVGLDGKKSVPADVKESLRVLAKLREAPWYYGEARDIPRLSSEVKDGHWHLISKDAPRFSYDGREISRLSFALQIRLMVLLIRASRVYDIRVIITRPQLRIRLAYPRIDPPQRTLGIDSESDSGSNLSESGRSFVDVDVDVWSEIEHA